MELNAVSPLNLHASHLLIQPQAKKIRREQEDYIVDVCYVAAPIMAAPVLDTHRLFLLLPQQCNITTIYMASALY